MRIDNNIHAKRKFMRLMRKHEWIWGKCYIIPIFSGSIIPNIFNKIFMLEPSPCAFS